MRRLIDADELIDIIKGNENLIELQKRELIECIGYCEHEDSPDALKEEKICEWEKGSSGYVGYPAYYSRCCTTHSNGLEMQTHIIADWKYCPYCGKKIKVVE